MAEDVQWTIGDPVEVATDQPAAEATSLQTLTPAFRIAVDGEDYTTRFQHRLISLQLRDVRGMEADQLTLSIDDHDNLLRFPRKGVEIALSIGWPGALVDKGIFTVDEIGHDGPPDKLNIVARSADVADTWAKAKERSWHSRTLEQIVNQLAGEHELTPAVSAALKPVLVPHVDQTNETDGHFLTRLAERYDAIATIKSKHLLFVLKGRGRAADGDAMPLVTIRRSDGDQHRYQEHDKETRYTGVKAFWDDKQGAQRRYVVWGREPKAGEKEHLRVLRDPIPTEAEAEEKAKGEWGRIQRGKATMSVTLARGRPDIIPEQPAKLEGWKREIVEQEWVLAEVTHEIGDNGYTTAVELEVKMPEDEDAGERRAAGGAGGGGGLAPGEVVELY